MSNNTNTQATSKQINLNQLLGSLRSQGKNSCEIPRGSTSLTA